MNKPLTPAEIVKELDKYIIGQQEAKRMVAIALRNRWRRQQVPEHLRDEIAPKNIIMIGPTGVGKTEIARRLAKLAQSPFLKVEATKFTEVGYVGRDVESMIRDLTDIAVNMVRQEELERVREKAAQLAEEKLLDILLPSSRKRGRGGVRRHPEDNYSAEETASDEIQTIDTTREKLRELLSAGKLNERYVEIDVSDRSSPVMEIFTGASLEELDYSIREMLNSMMPRRTRRRKVKIPEAKELLTEEEAQKLVDMDKVIRTAVERVQQSGIIFIDEIDKIVGRDATGGPDVSREGVQRDLLPIVEGSTVMTKYGMVKTDHILFIASGAFHIAKPSDLIPELQGRFPIRVELKPLTKEDFVKILTEPENALTTQYKALLQTEGIELVFEADAIEAIAEIAYEVNSRTENIGARRLHTIMEKLLSDISFQAPELQGQTIRITRQYVLDTLKDIVEDQDLSRYIL